MKLGAYLELSGQDDAAFAAKVGCDRTTISRIRRGETRPSHALMVEIARESRGAVLPNDYFPELPEAAA